MPAKITFEEWIRRCKEQHGDKYDYSASDFKGSSKKVDIICPIHGQFNQLAKYHANGCECPKCANETTKEKKVEDLTCLLYTSPSPRD